MKKKSFLSLFAALITASAIGLIACINEDKDMTPPDISGADSGASPTNCQVYRPGNVIPFYCLFTDDTELGSFNIEIHGNFDHHSHSTSSVECEEEGHEEHVDPQNPWVFNQSYNIPEGQRKFEVRLDIPIPADIDLGDYHFMLRVTDRAGWQQLKAVAIKII